MFRCCLVLVICIELRCLVFLLSIVMVKFEVFSLCFWLVVKLVLNISCICIVGIVWCLVSIILMLLVSLLCWIVGKVRLGKWLIIGMFLL